MISRFDPHTLEWLESFDPALGSTMRWDGEEMPKESIALLPLSSAHFMNEPGTDNILNYHMKVDTIHLFAIFCQ